MRTATSCLPNLFEEFDEFKPIATLFNNYLRAEGSGSGVNIAETEDSVIVEAPVPGCLEEHIEITFEKGILLIKAEEKEEKKEGVKYILKSSRQYAYRIPISTRVDEQAAPEATYKQGILQIKFQKSRSARPMKIQVK